MPDLRDDLQRVAAPAEVCVWEAPVNGTGNGANGGFNGGDVDNGFGRFQRWVFWRFLEMFLVDSGIN